MPNLFKKMKNDNFLKSLILITLLGLIIRLIHLEVRPPTFDEAISIALTKSDIETMIRGTIADVHPPIYFFLLTLWSKVNSDLYFLRFFSVVFGTISIYAIGLAAQKLFNQKVGILSALLAALSPVFIFEATNTRMYALAILESILIIFFFWEFVKTQRMIYFLWLLLSLVLGIYTQYYFVLIVIVLNLFIFLKERANMPLLKKWLILQFFIFAFSLPLFYLFITSNHPQLFPFSNSLFKIPGVFVIFVSSWDTMQILKIYPFETFSYLQFSLTLLTAGFLLLFLYGLRFLKTQPSLVLFSILYFLIPISLVSLISFFVKPVFGVRSFILFSPLFYILTAFGLSKIKHNLLKVLFFVLMIIFLSLQFQGFRNYQASYEPYQFVKENLKPGDILAYSDWSFLVLGRYHLGEAQNHLPLIPIWLSPEMSKAIRYEVKNINDFNLKGRRLWYFTLNPQFFNHDLTEEKRKEFEVLYPIVWKKKYDNLYMQITLFDLGKN